MTSPKTTVPPVRPDTSPQEVLHPIEKPPSFAALTASKKKLVIGAVYALLVLLGVGTGYLLSQKISLTNSGFGKKPGFIKTDKVIGTTDTKTFRDSAEGTIEKDGVDGEGTHRLIREGGPSQTAFLISSVIDLDEYIGKKVKIYGETFAAQKASWLMDVGKIELLE